MSPQLPRRRVLQTAGGALLAGLAGCQLQRAETETPTDRTETEETPTPTTYGITVNNRLEAEAFETTQGLSGPKPAVVHLRVTDLDPDSEQVYFEETVEVKTGKSTTFQEAFTASPGGPTYAMNAELEPFVKGGIGRPENRKDGVTFEEGGYGEPGRNPIEVHILDLDAEGAHGMYPVISIVHEAPDG